MNEYEAAELLGHCAAFDNRKPSIAARAAWAAALYDVPLDADAKAAVVAYYTTSPRDPEAKLWILPHHVRTLRAKIRSKRLENYLYEPVDGETVPEFIARYRGQTQAIASGRVQVRSGRPALEGGPSRKFLDDMRDRGYRVGLDTPESDAEAAIAAVRRAGPLGVQCPTCRAVVGRPCRIPGGSDRRPLGKAQVRPHSARRRVAAGEPDLTDQQRAAEEQRRREASRWALARMEADGEIVDAEIVENGEVS